MEFQTNIVRRDKELLTMAASLETSAGLNPRRRSRSAHASFRLSIREFNFVS
jgi:hypothetical protein